MIVKNMISVLSLIVVFQSCSKIDNYKAPDGNIYGKLVDKITKENIQTEQPNGYSVKLFEKGGKMNSPIVVPGKPDGTFENAFIFQNEYMVLPTEGAFFPVDTVKVQVGSHTEVNFEVMPFLAVTNVTITPSAGKVTANYTIARSQVGDKIVERKTLVSRVPTVNNSVNDFRSQTDLAGKPDLDILAAPYSDVVTGLNAGTKYYVRIAVRTNNGLKKYNYSKVFTVAIP
ncbi:MAG: DUF3823 domain-containing protein [Chitinophagaceae bacterium]